MTSIGDIRKALMAERKRIDKALAALGEAPAAPRKRKAAKLDRSQVHCGNALPSATGSILKRKRGRPRKDAAQALTPSGL